MSYISNIPTDSPHTPKRLAIMGSTGSIGTNAISIIQKTPHMFRVTALAAGKNIELLAKQAKEFKPPFLAVQNIEDVPKLRALLPKEYHVEILYGKAGFAQLASLETVDMVVSAQVGAAGLYATVAAAQAGKTICLANKESLVLAGDFIRYLAKKNHAIILPVDSEHYAIFHCLFSRYATQKDLSNAYENDIKTLILTASGGPFRGKNATYLQSVTKEDALNHPNWNMGAKITIDSATLMNKGLEVIEACHLYGIPIEKVEVLVHPSSIVHSLVEWQDASLSAQLASPHMNLPIGNCMTWPHMLTQEINQVPTLNLTKQSLIFEQVDHETFPCLNLARYAYAHNLCVELNAANEIAVELFLNNEIPFLHIANVVEHVLKDTNSPKILDFNQLSMQDVLSHIEERDTKSRLCAKSY